MWPTRSGLSNLSESMCAVGSAPTARLTNRNCATFSPQLRIVKDASLHNHLPFITNFRIHLANSTRPMILGAVIGNPERVYIYYGESAIAFIRDFDLLNYSIVTRQLMSVE